MQQIINEHKLAMHKDVQQQLKSPHINIVLRFYKSKKKKKNQIDNPPWSFLAA
jgi:hypothetical protein